MSKASKVFWGSKTAVFGLFVICFTIVIALLGYWIMPDNTPNANDRIAELKKQAPGFSTRVYLVKRNVDIEEVNFLSCWLSGQESPYIARPFLKRSYNQDSTTITLAINVGGATYSNETYEVTTNVAFVEEHLIETRTYYLGTDLSGRDILSKLIFGARISIAIGCISVVISAFIGVFLGAFAGYYGGWIDQVVLWFMSVVWSVPRIMLVIAISMALQQVGIWITFVAVGLTMWVEVARVVRGKVLEIKEQQFVEAAKSYGAGSYRIITRHVLPMLLGPMVVVLTANFADAILIEAGLSFLGLGVKSPMPSWGLMIQEGYALITSKGAWFLIFFPAISISLLVFSFNLVGNGLRDAYETKKVIK